jgi:hypothetical protein
VNSQKFKFPSTATTKINELDRNARDCKLTMKKIGKLCCGSWKVNWKRLELFFHVQQILSLMQTITHIMNDLTFILSNDFPHPCEIKKSYRSAWSAKFFAENQMKTNCAINWSEMMCAHHESENLLMRRIKMSFRYDHIKVQSNSLREIFF